MAEKNKKTRYASVGRCSYLDEKMIVQWGYRQSTAAN